MFAAAPSSRTPSLTTSEETVASSSNNTPSPISPNHHLNSKSSPSSQRVSSPLLLLPCQPHSFIRTWSQPRILQLLLSRLSWHQFYAVSCSSRDLRQTFRNPLLKEIILSRFIPAYSDAHHVPDDHIHVSISDLHALMCSQAFPLHRYPMHAVHCETALHGISPAARAYSDYLILLAQSHSRFVLLLRSRAPLSPLPFDADDLFFRQNSLSGLRVLTFPPPLSYFDTSRQTSFPPPAPPDPKKKRSKKRPSTAVGPTHTSDKRRVSIFGQHRDLIPPPAPQSCPPSIRYYSTFRRSRHFTSKSFTDDDDACLPSHHDRFMSDILPPPRFPFTHSKLSSSNSSLGSSRSVSSPSQASTSTSAHDLSNALSRTRAPILRVFVPCSILSESLAAAERQLFAGGLWPHLRIGDVVCNLGYVPEDSGSARGWLVFNGTELSPFFPPASAPVPDHKSLPTPLYFAHLLPPTEDPHVVLDVPRGVRMTLQLALLSNSMPSPHSRAGLVKVKRYSWLGRMRVREQDMALLGMGEGWAGEWVLEAEGTKEGRQVLVDAVEGEETGERLWVVVRERSGAGKWWLRAASEHRALDNLSLET